MINEKMVLHLIKTKRVSVGELMSDIEDEVKLEKPKDWAIARYNYGRKNKLTKSEFNTLKEWVESEEE